MWKRFWIVLIMVTFLGGVGPAPVARAQSVALDIAVIGSSRYDLYEIRGKVVASGLYPSNERIYGNVLYVNVVWFDSDGKEHQG